MSSMNWMDFLEEVEKNPKNFAKAAIEHLRPPKYAVDRLRKLGFLCDFCWNPRVDECFNCHRSICEEHIGKIFIGEKTKLEWRICPACLGSSNLEELKSKVDQQDGEFKEEEALEDD